jgi:hypothetical protein
MIPSAGEDTMTALREDIAAYERERRALEAKHRGKWAVFHAGQYVGVFLEFDQAATEAVERFGSGPYLIRQVGVEKIQLSSTLIFRPSHAHSAGGV